MTSSLHLVVPGPIEQRTGGYIYDRRIVEGLRALGWTVRVHELAGRFPQPDAVAYGSMLIARGQHLMLALDVTPEGGGMVALSAASLAQIVGRLAEPGDETP